MPRSSVHAAGAAHRHATGRLALHRPACVRSCQ